MKNSRDIDSTANSQLQGKAVKKKRSRTVDFLVRLVREKPLGMIGGVITLIMLLVGIFAGAIAPFGMNELHTADMLQSPSATYWLGTDNMGRDILTRVIYGARISVIVGLAGSLVAILFSIAIGMPSGYFGGKFDLILQRFVDAWMCFPALILMMVLISVIGPSMWAVILVVGIRTGIAGSRILRGATITVKENMYVSAATAIGCSPTRILMNHILPNIMAPVIILFTTRVPVIILTEASLSFLGFGIPPPTPSWGGMLSGSGRSFMFLNPGMVIWPGLALSLVIYGVSMFGDAVRDLLDPRLRGGVGRYGVKRKKSNINKSAATS
jgi:peptide/nickel transport system permease protein